MNDISCIMKNFVIPLYFDASPKPATVRCEVLNRRIITSDISEITVKTPDGNEQKFEVADEVADQIVRQGYAELYQS